MKIYSVALLPQPNHCEVANTPAARLQALSHCLQATKSVFELIASFNLSEFRNFSMVEWSRLINSIVMVFRLCAVTPTVREWEFGPTQQKAQFGVYLESLSFRMGELSTVGEHSSNPPDVFCMFKSVLRVVCEIYEEMATRLSQDELSNSDIRGDTIPHCPIFTKKITGTEYWDILNKSNANVQLDSGIFTASGDVDIFSQMAHWNEWDNGITQNNGSSVFGSTSYEY